MAESDRSKNKLNVRVSEFTKEEWQEALPEGDSLTSLVTRTVNRELNDEYVHIDQLESLQDIGDLNVDLGDVSDELSGLHEVLNRCSDN